MNDVGHVLLGAVLVAVGILSAAVADRIRGLRITHERARAVGSNRAAIDVVDPELVPIPKPERAPTPRVRSNSQQSADDVIAALVAAGHKKQVATEAVWGCNASERATIENWTRSALRRCVRVGLS